jgi:hypothetical protein
MARAQQQTIANAITLLGSSCRYRRGTRGSLRSGNVSVQPTLRLHTESDYG